MQLRDRTVVIAGNGASLAELPPGAIMPDDFIIRTNNFFFEPRFYLGRRVDLAFMGGDPRVAPFMFETLYRCGRDYDLKGWSSHNPRVVRAGKRRFAPTFQPMQYRDASIEKDVLQLIAQHKRHPTTGIYAALMAHGIGANKVLLVGMDFYGTQKRYPFTPGPQYRALMGQDLGQRGLDQHLHNLDLDYSILRLLQSRGEIQLLRVSDNPLLRDVSELISDRGGKGMELPRTNPPTDWASRAGLYPIGMLKTLRQGSALVRKIKKGLFL
jgi:hypothetical protein